MKKNTSELTRRDLDWAVSMIIENSRIFPLWFDGKPQSYAAYSTDWSQGGPLIEREKICTSTDAFGNWMSWIYDGLEMVGIENGPTPLVAAMRCFVAIRLGDEVDVPEEFK